MPFYKKPHSSQRSERMKNHTTQNIQRVFFSVVLMSLLFLLAGYILAGWYTRYKADDYCYDAQFIQKGFLQGQIDSYLHLTPYSSNRYALTLFSGIAWLLGGVKFMPVLPGLMILLWGAALYDAIQQGTKFLSLKMPTSALLFTAAAILFYTLLLAPNRYQVLYWRSGMLPYLAPLVIQTFLAGRFLHTLQQPNISLPACLGLGFLAWIAAGFSETAFALQAGFWGVLLVVTVWQRRPAGSKAVMAIVVGTLIGFILLIANPTNSIRQSPFPPPPPLWAVALRSVEFAWDFFFFSFRGTPVPFVFIFLSGLLMGLELPLKSFRWAKMLWGGAAMVIFSGILLCCIMAPTIWSMSAYPENRSLLTGIYVMCLFFISLGVLSGAAGQAVLKQIHLPVIKWVLGGMLTLFLTMYAIHFIPPTFGLIEEYRDRAAAWDQRDAMIREAREMGQSRIVIPGIDSYEKIIELQPYEYRWPNFCAAIYYGVDALVTTE